MKDYTRHDIADGILTAYENLTEDLLNCETVEEVCAMNPQEAAAYGALQCIAGAMFDQDLADELYGHIEDAHERFMGAWYRRLQTVLRRHEIENLL